MPEVQAVDARATRYRCGACQHTYERPRVTVWGCATLHIGRCCHVGETAVDDSSAPRRRVVDDPDAIREYQ